MSDRAARPNPLDIIASDRSLYERVLLIWDLAMIGLVSFNLVLIVADWLFTVDAIARALAGVWPAGHDWYKTTIHAHFFAIDLVFVAVFVVDVLAGWTVAIVRRTYYRWFFYPFVHWYDVLGTIPVAGFRFLRVLRVIAIVMRLQRLGVLDVRNWAVYKNLMVYYDIVVEEISDRVVIKVLSGAQEELVSGGNALSRRVISEVIQPRQKRLVEAASDQIEDAVTGAYKANREQLQAYIAKIVHNGVEHNPALKNLERVPMLGGFVSRSLDAAISETVNDVLDEAVAGLATQDFDALVENITESVMSRLLDEDIAEASEIRDAVVEVLDLVKDQVAVQRWREHFE